MATVPNIPMRRLDKNDKALLNAADWADLTDLKLEDKVSLADGKAAFLQGLVTYVGKVKGEEGVWVGVHLTGPSVGRGNCNGTFKGQRYFADVGKNNGSLAPLDKISRRIGVSTGDAKLDELQQKRQSEESRLADLEFIDCLVEERATAMLKLDSERKKKGLSLSRFKKEETYITRLKQLRMEELMKARGVAPPPGEKSKADEEVSKNKYAGPDSILQPCDLELAEGLEATQQNFCLSDPSLPDNPITYVSQSFLNMTGYNLNEILGRNCRFLQGPGTDPYHVFRIRKSIQEGADCHVCFLNFRKDGTPFYNRLFMTALRDTRGRIKNYLGVQCEVNEMMAREINLTEKIRFEAKSKQARMGSTFEEASESGYDFGGQDFSDRTERRPSSVSLRKNLSRREMADLPEAPMTPKTSRSSSIGSSRSSSIASNSPMGSPASKRLSGSTGNLFNNNEEIEEAYYKAVQDMPGDKEIEDAYYKAVQDMPGDKSYMKFL